MSGWFAWSEEEDAAVKKIFEFCAKNDIPFSPFRLTNIAKKVFHEKRTAGAVIHRANILGLFMTKKRKVVINYKILKQLAVGGGDLVDV